jgi:hypothetical protein
MKEMNLKINKLNKLENELLMDYLLKDRIDYIKLMCVNIC